MHQISLHIKIQDEYQKKSSLTLVNKMKSFGCFCSVCGELESYLVS